MTTMNSTNSNARVDKLVGSTSLLMGPEGGTTDIAFADNSVYPTDIFNNSNITPESVVYYEDHPAELSTEIDDKYEFMGKNDDFPYTNFTSPLGTTALTRYYEYLQSYEKFNDVYARNDTENSYVESICNLNVPRHKKRSDTLHKEDASVYIHTRKSTQVVENITTSSNKVAAFDTSQVVATSVEVQTDPIIQRNVSQQTYSQNVSNILASDGMGNEADIGREICDCRMLSNERNCSVERMKLDCEGVKWFDIIGLVEAKLTIREALFLPLSHPHLYTSLRGSLKRCCRCLLYGPPGTGKTLVAKAIASELGANLYYISCAGILSCYIGESEKNVRELFEFVIARVEPSVIFFDEIDSVCRKRTEGESEHSRRLKTELLKYFECPAMNKSQVYIISATNCPWDLDPAFLRRFQRHIYISMPDRATQRQVISKHLGSIESLLSEEDWTKLLNETDGLSTSDLMNFISVALAQPNREILTATHWRYFDDEHVSPCDPSSPEAFAASVDDIPPERVMARSLEVRDFLNAAQATPRTVSNELVEQFERFKKRI